MVIVVVVKKVAEYSQISHCLTCCFVAVAASDCQQNDFCLL